MLDLSPTAVAEIKRIKSQQTPDTCLRLTVKPGGCLDFFYDLTFESEVNDSEVTTGDCAFEIDGISFVVDNCSWEYIRDLKLDYAEDLMGGGFRFHNPQHQKTCGCGISFNRSAQS